VKWVSKAQLARPEQAYHSDKSFGQTTSVVDRTLIVVGKSQVSWVISGSSDDLLAHFSFASIKDIL
jgi:hypothetical protein